MGSFATNVTTQHKPAAQAKVTAKPPFAGASLCSIDYSVLKRKDD
jgi:hypothetical protein